MLKPTPQSMPMGILLRAREFVRGWLTRGHERSLEAKKNILASFVIKGFSISISLLMVPLTINYVNPTQYGIWLTLSSIVAWFSFFDVGFGNGLRNRFAEAKAVGDLGKARIYVSTTYLVLTMIFAGVWLTFVAGNQFIDWSMVLNAPVDLKAELSLLALIVFTFFCLQIVLQTISTVVIADQKPARSAMFDTAGQFLTLVAVFALTRVSEGSLVKLGTALGSIPVLVLLVASIWLYRTHYRAVAPSLSLAKKAYAKDIMKLGVQFFVIQIAVIVIYQTTNIVIAQVSGPADVTVYNIAFKYFSIAMLVFGIIMGPFWSAFTDAFARSDYAWMKRTEARLRMVALAGLALIIIMIAAAATVYRLWIGEAVQVRWSVSVVVAIYVATNIWNMLYSMLLNGMGKIRLQLYVSLLGTALNIPLAIALGRVFGIEGVVLSSILLNLISAIYAPIQVKRLLDRSAKGIWNA
jgi:O-antigen/teichoic acid export membrane protein